MTNFNWEQFNPEERETRSFTPIPAGVYRAIISEAEWRDTSKGGRMLSLRIELLDKPFEGRVVFDNLNLENANETAVQIAQDSLADICKAIQIRPRSEADLINKPLSVRLKVKLHEGEARNEVKGYASARAVAPITPSVVDETKKPALQPVGKGGPAVAPGGEDDIPF